MAQAYDLLRLPLYSLYYYQRAVAIRPYDGRMWNALGSCFDYLNQHNEAIKCMKRALSSQDTVEPAAFAKLAKLYLKLGQFEYKDTIAYYYRKYLEEHDRLVDLVKNSKEYIFIMNFSQMENLSKKRDYIYARITKIVSNIKKQPSIWNILYTRKKENTFKNHLPFINKLLLKKKCNGYHPNYF